MTIQDFINNLQKLVSGLETGTILPTEPVTNIVREGIRKQFSADGMTEDGTTGTWPENRGAYARWKLRQVGHLDPMRLSERLQDSAEDAEVTVETGSGKTEIVARWDAQRGGKSYARHWQNREVDKRRRIVVTPEMKDAIGSLVVKRATEVLMR